VSSLVWQKLQSVCFSLRFVPTSSVRCVLTEDLTASLTAVETVHLINIGTFW